MSNHANPPTENPLQEQNEEYALQEYLAGLDTPPKVTEIAPVAEPTLADIDPYENEQFEQEMRDTQMEKDSRWLARLIHFWIRKRR